MKKAVFAPTLILAGLLVAGVAQADPYGSWKSSVSDDDSISIVDSFKSSSAYTYSQDNDVTEDNDIDVS